MAIQDGLVQALSVVLDDMVPSLRLKNASTVAEFINQGLVSESMKRSLDWAANAGGDDAQGQALTDDGTESSGSSLVPANLRIGDHKIQHTMRLNKADVKDAQRVGAGEVRDIYATALSQGIEAIMRKLNRSLYSGDGLAASGGIIGLNSAYNAYASYAGIDPATYSAWRPITHVQHERVLSGITPADGTTYTLVFDAGAGDEFEKSISYTAGAGDTATDILDALAIELESQFSELGTLDSSNSKLVMRTPAQVAGTNITVAAATAVTRALSRPLMSELITLNTVYEGAHDIVLAHPTTIEKYRTLFDTVSQEYQITHNQSPEGLRFVDLGYGSVAFNGTRITQDRNTPTDVFYCLDSSALSLRTFVLDTDNPANSPDPISPIEVNRSTGLPIHLAALPTNNSAVLKVEMYVLAQLQVKNRRGLSGILSLT